MELMVDCNQGWRTPGETSTARALEGLGVSWMEEPLHRADRARMAGVRQMTDIRIANDTLVGGTTGLRRVEFMARDPRLTFTPHRWSNGIGMLANAHRSAGVGDARWLEWPYDPPEWFPERRDYPLLAPLKAEGGWLQLGNLCGLGIDEESLAATRLARRSGCPSD
jgi:L-rhamnonate dehydratase